MINNNLTNFGIITQVIPSSLLSTIQEECNSVGSHSHYKFNTGFTREGSPDHFLVKNNKDEIKKVAIELAHGYIQKYKKAILTKMKAEGYNNLLSIEAQDPWINIQKKHDYLPNHDHAGFLSYSLWVKIPEDSKFEFTYNTITGDIFREQINITKEFEGTIVMFPSKLIHCVYPFYNSDEERVSISGNINLKTSK